MNAVSKWFPPILMLMLGVGLTYGFGMAIRAPKHVELETHQCSERHRVVAVERAGVLTYEMQLWGCRAYSCHYWTTATYATRPTALVHCHGKIEADDE